jgi:hypothetical protein
MKTKLFQHKNDTNKNENYTALADPCKESSHSFYRDKVYIWHANPIMKKKKKKKN